jgi:hypothetical protein
MRGFDDDLTGSTWDMATAGAEIERLDAALAESLPPL